MVYLIAYCLFVNAYLIGMITGARYGEGFPSLMIFLTIIVVVVCQLFSIGK